MCGLDWRPSQLSSRVTPAQPTRLLKADTSTRSIMDPLLYLESLVPHCMLRVDKRFGHPQNTYRHIKHLYRTPLAVQ